MGQPSLYSALLSPKLRDLSFSKMNHVRFAFPLAEPDVIVRKKTYGNPAVTAVHVPQHSQANPISRPSLNPVYVACSLATKSRKEKRLDAFNQVAKNNLPAPLQTLQMTPLPAESRCHVLAHTTCLQKRIEDINQLHVSQELSLIFCLSFLPYSSVCFCVENTLQYLPCLPQVY